MTLRAPARCLRARIVPVQFTRADWDRLPEGFPAQLVGGMLVKEASPNYGHVRVESRILAMLSTLLSRDRVLPAPADVAIDEYNVFQPDVVVVREIPSDDAHDVGIPLLVVEVVSPSTARRDRGVKRRRLLAAGVEEVWIVDREAGTVEVYDASGCRVATGEEAIASHAVPGFEVVPSRLFAPPER